MFDYVLASLIALILSFFSGQFSGEENTILQPTVAEVVSVVDGDTIKVQIGGREETVRYIGIDTPEPYRDGEPACFSREATKRNTELVEGNEVRLVSDHEDEDKYGRLLRYVYVGDVFVNQTLIEEGYAKKLSIYPNTEHAAEFARIQSEAKEEKKGLWGACEASKGVQ
ncbi:MAG: hypothetical protein RLZZ76_282 [Candidatus Parcubacteria bacterium]|jgi:micrococcal nuclease